MKRLIFITCLFFCSAGAAHAFTYNEAPEPVIGISTFSDIDVPEVIGEAGAGADACSSLSLSGGHEGFELYAYRTHPVAEKAVSKSIDFLSEDIRRHFSIWLERAAVYLGMMKTILKEEGVPEEIAYLPLIESGFSAKAYSRKKAAGFWQFISATGKRYGLKINKYVDERRDPVKSTRAAARYLKDLHGMFGSWSLAMAAYNAGEMKIQKALVKSKYTDYWDITNTKFIRKETKNYVPLFIAASMIAKNPEDYGFADPDYQPDFLYDEAVLERPLSIAAIAKCAETTPDKVKELNPELKGNSTPPVEKYTLRLPHGGRDLFLANLSKLPASEMKIPLEPAGASLRYYTIRQGDTVWDISRRTGIPQKEILALNKINKNTTLKIGRKLLLPSAKNRG